VHAGNAKYFSLVVAGLTRLFLKDPEREARVQAATFLTAYLLGLPCFCFRPNVLETLRMTEMTELRGKLTSPAGLNALLVYLLAPVAAERSRHNQLIVSDPRQAEALMQILRERNRDLGVDDEKSEAMITWAYNQAKRLLTTHESALESVRKRMEGGGATAGDCVSILEKQVSL